MYISTCVLRKLLVVFTWINMYSQLQLQSASQIMLANISKEHGIIIITWTVSIASVLFSTSLWKQGFLVAFVAVNSITVSMFNHTMKVEKMMYLRHWTQDLFKTWQPHKGLFCCHSVCIRHFFFQTTGVVFFLACIVFMILDVKFVNNLIHRNPCLVPWRWQRK